MKERTAYPGGSYVDALPSGERAVLYSGRHIETDQGLLALPGEDVLFHRITKVGGFQVIGKGHGGKGTAWHWSAAHGWRDLGATHGNSPVIFNALGQPVIFTYAGPNTPGQGFRYVDDQGGIVTGDETYGHHKHAPLNEWTETGGVVIGQGASGCRVWIDGVLRELEPGHTTFVRVHREGDLFAVSIVKPDEAVIWRISRDELARLPEGGAQQPEPHRPPPLPEPEPPPRPEEPVRYPEFIQRIVNELYERNKPLAHSQSDDDRRTLARMIAQQVVFDSKDDTYGLKSNHGLGQAQSKDTLAQRRGEFRPNERQKLYIWDLFDGGTRKPNQFPESIAEHESDQYFWPVDPRDHLGRQEPEPEPRPDPEPEPQPKPPDTALAKKVHELERVVLAQKEHLADLALDYSAQERATAALTERIEAVEKGGGAKPAPTDGHATEKTLRELLAAVKKALAKLP